jgi:hypothetical protein
MVNGTMLSAPAPGEPKVCTCYLLTRAKQLDGVRERGPGFVTASVVDPFGNVLGIMYNRHYLGGSCQPRGPRHRRFARRTKSCAPQSRGSERGAAIRIRPAVRRR